MVFIKYLKKLIKQENDKRNQENKIQVDIEKKDNKYETSRKEDEKF